MLRITCVVFVLAVVAMVSASKGSLTQAVIKARVAAGNSKLSVGNGNLYRDAEGMAESCDISVVADIIGGIAYADAGDSADDALAFASKLGAQAGPADSSSIACDSYKCPDGNVIGACAFE
ncbi:uncharacterized protein LOC124141065 [Haliotis rufescens]|uniref:uncharacterized protein LOC124141065 n=1 Tax=Haliotis rufescens TaxID=6454 RepID=UPI00201FA3DD|nr:uncharacterized protein LOC124141065 [Haliotis rufescens]